MKKKSKIVTICATITMVILMCIVLPFCVTGCNKQVWDTQYTFNNAYVKIGEEWVDLEISSWGDYEGEQLQLKLKDGTVMVVSSINCILYNGTLPQ